MFKVWLVTGIVVSLLLVKIAAKHAKVSSIIHERLRRDANLEESLRQMRLLLHDPVDEEHDELENESDETHAHEWTVQLTADNDDLAEKLRAKYGFDHVKRLALSPGLYRYTHLGNVKKEAESVSKVQEEEAAEKIVNKRDHIAAAKNLGADENVSWFQRERILHREKRVPIDLQEDNGEDLSYVVNDPKFHEQWYIENTGQTAGPPRFDSNILKVWKRGFTGRGVKVSVLDDGVDWTHPELRDNYDPKASTDLNGHDSNPQPNDKDVYNAHGTKCAGTIAAKANNSLCGVGIAFNAKIGGIRMLDGKATDSLEANALSFHRNEIDIYSCSWGPKDNGKTFGRPGKFGRIALAQGALYGRKGKGSIFVWATGNGGLANDDCDADGYVNSIYTVGIGSVNEHGVSTYYGERCPSMFAVTYCSGQHNPASYSNAKADVITTFLHHKCTNHFVGTSSAAPLVGGIFALVLEANPNLTWRDMQHLVFHTAKQTSPYDAGWAKNGCGKLYNHKFGFGVLDADLLVDRALNWTNVAPQKNCHFNLNFKNGDIPHNHHFKLSFVTDGCQSCKKKNADGKCPKAITKLEHVIVNVTLKHRQRGNLAIDLISPSGTVSHLLHSRPSDCSHSGLKGWVFMTVFNWCENPKGKWQLIFTDKDPQETTLEKKSQDPEQRYIEYLDKRKAKLSKGNEVHATVNDEKKSTEKSVNANVEEQVYDQYKREEPNVADEVADEGKDERYNGYNSYNYNHFNHQDDYPSSRDYNRRKRRSNDYCGVTQLDNKLLAGEVKAVSVTFYGT